MKPRLVIAGTHSGVGKTTLTVGLIAALSRRGLSVQPFKVGPDYIDPGYHTLAAGRPCRNLDTWLVPPDRLRVLFAHAVRDVDIALIEGVMGIYDGADYDAETGSTAEVAKLLESPVILVLDCRSMARSAGAVALGYQQFDPELSLVGFIANRVGSENHGRGVAMAIERATNRPVLGWLPRETALEIPERHLGLVPTAEPGRWLEFIEAAADCVERYLDVDRILALAGWEGDSRAAGVQSGEGLPFVFSERDRAPAVIAVARDEAFSFAYQDNLDLLEAAGASLAYFSPLWDTELPPSAMGVMLSGGFPELYADRLAANLTMHESIRHAHARGLPIYAECGGLMYLTETLVDLEGREHAMVGLLPGRSTMAGRLTLGYRLVQAAEDSWLLTGGETVRGHEFHFSVWEGRPVDLPPAYFVLSRNGGGEPRPEGAHLGNLWASYVHLHFWNKPELAARFAAAAGSV